MEFSSFAMNFAFTAVDGYLAFQLNKIQIYGGFTLFNLYDFFKNDFSSICSTLIDSNSITIASCILIRQYYCRKITNYYKNQLRRIQIYEGFTLFDIHDFIKPYVINALFNGFKFIIFI